MTKYRFSVEYTFNGYHELELEDDAAALRIVDNEYKLEDFAGEVFEQGGPMSSAECDWLQKYDEDAQRWVDVYEE